MPGCWPADPDLGAVDDAGLPVGTEVVDDLGQGPQPHTLADGAPSLGEQGPHLCDGPSDGGAVHTEPAGEHMVRGGMPEVLERGQEPVDKHQPVLRTRAHSPLPRPGRKPGLVPVVPQRPNSARSSAITSAARPVILRALMIAPVTCSPITRP